MVRQIPALWRVSRKTIAAIEKMTLPRETFPLRPTFGFDVKTQQSTRTSGAW